MAGDAGGASARLGQRRQDVHSGRLACPVRPEQRDDLTAADLEADVAHRMHVTERLAECL